MSSLVSPQMPIILESSTVRATRRFSESGETLCKNRFSMHSLIAEMLKSSHRIGIDRKDILIKRRIDSNDIAHLMINFEFQRVHRSVKVYAVEVVHQEDL